MAEMKYDNFTNEELIDRLIEIVRSLVLCDELKKYSHQQLRENPTSRLAQLLEMFEKKAPEHSVLLQETKKACLIRMIKPWD